MRFVFAVSFLLSPFALAQSEPVVTVSTSSSIFFCRVEEFAAKKAVTKAFKRCDSLVEAVDKPTKSAEECKEYGLTKGRQCLKLSGADQISVKVKFTEKFGQNSNLTSYTCELDKSGASACP